MVKDIILYLRREKGISQAQLAKQLNVCQGAISLWELGKAEPTESNIIAICKYFDISADYLLGLKDY